MTTEKGEKMEHDSLKRIFIMRHGESLEDIDKTAYERVSDEDMPLSPDGISQVKLFCNNFLEHFKPKDLLRIIVSDNTRLKETADLLITGLSKKVTVDLEVCPMIKKQDWGNVTIHNRKEIETQRYKVGVLRYQFPGGENGTSLLTRFNTFSLKLISGLKNGSPNNVLIITHGFEMRVLLMSLLTWTEEYFETLAHPLHCELKRLILAGDGRLTLIDSMRQFDSTTIPNFVRRETLQSK